MGAIGEQRRADRTLIIESRGRDTTVNGHTIKSLWQNAGIVAIQRFINENDWALSAYELRLPYYAIAAPYNLKNGTEVVRTELNWRGVVRNVTPEDSDNTVIQINALVVETTE